MDYDTFFDVAMEHLQSVTRTETVIGEPFDAGGRRFVPVTEIRLGIGAVGGAGGPNGSETTPGGGGLMGGFRVTPVAVVCMEQDLVKVLPVRQRKGTVERVLDLLPDILARLKDAGQTVTEIGKEAAARARDLRAAIAEPAPDPGRAPEEPQA